MKFTKTVLCSIMLISGISVAHADNLDMGTVKTATATVSFTPAVTLAHTITPEENLVAGDIQNKLVATGKVTSSNQGVDGVAIRWTSAEVDQMNSKKITLNNKTGANPATFELKPSSGDFDASGSLDPRWGLMKSTTNGFQKEYDYKISIANGSASSVTGQYDLSVDAAIWVL